MIICVTNRALCQGSFLDRIESIARQGTTIMLREKDLPEPEYLQLAEQCKEICDHYHTKLIVNHFIAVAKKLFIPNIHLSMPVFLEQRDNLKNFEKIGVSVHSLQEAMLAQQKKANYLIAGHIFATNSKKGVPPRGLEFLEEICKNVSIPVYAIGGIDEKNIEKILQTGAAGGCFMSSFMQCENPVAFIEKLKHSIS